MRRKAPCKYLALLFVAFFSWAQIELSRRKREKKRIIKRKSTSQKARKVKKKQELAKCSYRFSMHDLIFLSTSISCLALFFLLLCRPFCAYLAKITYFTCWLSAIAFNGPISKNILIRVEYLLSVCFHKWRVVQQLDGT